MGDSVGERISKGVELADEDRFDEAIRRMEEILGSEVDSEPALAAASEIRRQIVRWPHARLLADLKSRARQARGEGRVADAEQLVLSALKIDRQDQEALQFLSQLDRSGGGGVGVGMSEQLAPPEPSEEALEQSAQWLAELDAVVARADRAGKKLQGVVRTVREALKKGDPVRAREILEDADEVAAGADLLTQLEAEVARAEQTLEESLEAARQALDAGDGEKARGALAGLPRGSRRLAEVRELREEADELVEKSEQRAAREEQARERAAEIERSLERGKVERAGVLLKRTRPELLELPVLEKLRDRVEVAQAIRRRVEKLLSEAEGLRAGGQIEEALRQVELGLELDGEHEGLNDLRQTLRAALAARTVGAAPRVPEADSGRTARIWVAILLAVGLAVVLFTVFTKDNGPKQNRPSPEAPGTGQLELVFSSPSLVLLDGVNLPEGGFTPSRSHSFRQLTVGTHRLKVCAARDTECSDPVYRSVSIRGGDNREEVEVPW